MSLRRKILLYSILPVAAVMAAVILVVLSQMRARMFDAVEDRLRIELTTAAQVIERGNQEAVSAARSMAAAQEGGLFGRREESLELARRVLADNPQFIAAYFGYEPNADGGDRTWRSRRGPAADSSDRSGRFLPYWFRAPGAGGRTTLEPMVDMDGLYYQGMKEKFLSGSSEDFTITEPYTYNNQNLIIEQTSPIVIDGEFVGIAGVDRGLDDLNQFLYGLKPFSSARLILISGRGRIIAATLMEILSYDVRTMDYKNLYFGDDGQVPEELYQRVGGKLELNPEVATESRLIELRSETARRIQHFVTGSNSFQLEHYESEVTGKEVLGASAHIPTGDWTLVMTVEADEVMAQLQSTMRWMALVAFVGIVCGIAVLVLVSTRITRRIESMSLLARRVADGDLTPEVAIETGDETGRLQESIRDMLSVLNGLVSKIRNATNRLSLTAAELFAGARQQESAVNEFSASTNEITAAASEIAATSDELLGAMKEIGRVADETAQLAETSSGGLRGMGGTMDRLNAETVQIAERFSAIDEKADQIGGAVKTVSKVAERTNMLSLSASIEAEKAGQYGTGFRVVAREIRRLADQTAVATLEIGNIVAEMQGAVRDGVTEMSSFAVEVGSGAAEVKRVGGGLEKIIRQVRLLTDRFAGVTDGMGAQSEGAGQIRDALVVLTDGVNQTEATLQDFNRASEQLQGAVGDLREEVGRFRVREHDGSEAAGARREVVQS